MLDNVKTRQSRLYEMVAEQVRGLIASGAVRVGERLPGERDLAERLGVSRIVIREAVKALRSEGLVDVKPGSGTFVLAPNADHASNALAGFLRMQRGHGAFTKLLEVRETLEVGIAERAALRATKEECDALEEPIRLMDKHRDDGAKYAQADHEFHLRLAEATHNELYELLLKPITSLLQDFRMLLHSHDPERTVRAGVEQHRAILSAVRDRDPSRAKREMRDHVRESRALFLRISLDDESPVNDEVVPGRRVR